ncbi:MAG: methyltransferase domain-containing protein, partial [Noviherbaspirillum sp.]
FDASLRALRPDGLIIFETPNPENASVGSCNFYSDPTHRHPLVPDVMEFIARQRGFAKAEILRLHPYPEFLRVQEDSDTARRLNHLFYGPQDFSVLAWKTRTSAMLDEEE